MHSLGRIQLRGLANNILCFLHAWAIFYSQKFAKALHHFTLWLCEGTMKIWGPLKLIQRPYHGPFWNWVMCGHEPLIAMYRFSSKYYFLYHVYVALLQLDILKQQLWDFETPWSSSLCQIHLFKVGFMQTCLVDHETLCIVCHVELQKGITWIWISLVP